MSDYIKITKEQVEAILQEDEQPIPGFVRVCETVVLKREADAQHFGFMVDQAAEQAWTALRIFPVFPRVLLAREWVLSPAKPVSERQSEVVGECVLDREPCNF
jgi:hypothetical protein